MTVRPKIKQRMDVLQHWMEENYHLKRPEVVEEHIQTITKFWSVMSEEDQDICRAPAGALQISH